MALKDSIVHLPNCPFHTFTEHLCGIRHSVHPQVYVHFQAKNGKTKLKKDRSGQGMISVKADIETHL